MSDEQQRKAEDALLQIEKLRMNGGTEGDVNEFKKHIEAEHGISFREPEDDYYSDNVIAPFLEKMETRLFETYQANRD